MAISFDTITNFMLPSALTKLADNFSKIVTEFGKTVYRDGSAVMTGDLDMNSNRIINHGYPVDDNDLATLAQVRDVASTIAQGPPGTPDNTYSTLAAFKASDIARKVASIVGLSGFTDGRFHWTLGNFTGKNDDINVIKADSTAINVGAWVRESSDNITFTQDGANAATRVLSDKVGETVSITDFGGVDDWNGTTGTNNFAAQERVLALPRPITIRLPRSPNGTGVYMVNGVTAQTDMTGVTWDPDPGVYFQTQGDSTIPATFIKGQTTTRELRTKYSFLRYETSLTPIQRKRVSELGRPASALNGELQIPVKLDMTKATNWQLSSWPNGSWAAAVPTSVDALTVNWGTPPASSFVATMLAVAPGDLIEFGLADASTYFPAICIFTDTGWIILRQEKTGDFTLLTKDEKNGVSGAVETDTVNATVANTNYRFVKSMVGVKIFDQRSFGLVINGTIIRRYSTIGNIQRAGCAGGFGTGGTFIVQSGVLYKDKKTLGIKPLRIVTMGDSTGDETVTSQSQFDFMRQFIGGIGGCQIETLTNLAHSGDTSAAQMAALGGVVFAGLGYDYCLIQVGINDIQTGVSVSTFVNNILTCINYCRASGVEPIVGIPAMFYSQAEAQVYNQDGGATTHSADGTSYRLELMRMLADNNVYCNLASFEDLGAVTASLLEMKNDDLGDTVLYDNVHPTVWGAMLMGYGWAKAVTAHATNAQRHEFDAGIPIPPDRFITNVGTSATPQLTFDGRMMTLQHALSIGTTIADGTTVGTLEKRYWPKADAFGALINLAGSSTPMAVAPGTWKISATDGTIKLWGVDAAAVAVSFGGATWKV